MNKKQQVSFLSSIRIIWLFLHTCSFTFLACYIMCSFYTKCFLFAGRSGVLKSIGTMGASILLRGGDGASTPGGDASKPISMADVVKQAAAGKLIYVTESLLDFCRSDLFCFMRS